MRSFLHSKESWNICIQFNDLACATDAHHECSNKKQLDALLMVSSCHYYPDITLTCLLQKDLNVFTIEVITDQSQQSICETSA